MGVLCNVARAFPSIESKSNHFIHYFISTVINRKNLSSISPALALAPAWHLALPISHHDNRTRFSSRSCPRNRKNTQIVVTITIAIAAGGQINKMSQGKPNVVFVLGPPGSGKGTQCARIVKTFGYVHLSAGDLLREERNNPSSEFGELIETHIRNGTIVPVEITCSLLENAMKRKQESGHNFFLIDGFPRSQDNLDGWTKQMSDKVNLLFVLFLTCAEEACLARCLGRDEGRSDDNPESLKKRIVTYNNTTMPVIQHYIGLDLVNTVDASADPDTVFEVLRPFFESFAPAAKN